MPRLCSPPFCSYGRPLSAFLPSWVHIFSPSVHFGQLLRLSDEDTEDRFNAVNLKMPPHPPPRSLHAHMHLLDSASMKSSRFSMHTHPLPPPCTTKAKKSRKHSYCLLQSLMKIEIPPLEKSGGGGGSNKERRGSPAVGSCRGIGGEEGPAGGWRRRRVVGRRREKKFTAAAAPAKTLLLHCRHEELKGAWRAG